MTSLPTDIEDAESLARFILSASWLYRDERPGCPVRLNAFLPHPRVELSVYRTTGWHESEISAQGTEVASDRELAHRDRSMASGEPYPANKTTFRYLGRGELSAANVRASGLNVVAKEPPIRHADIIGWPPLTNNRKHDEASQMAFAIKLQASARFVEAAKSHGS